MIRQILGLRELQQFLSNVIEGLRGTYLIGAIERATEEARKYAASVTHVDTGSLQGAHETEIDSARNVGYVQISQSARNPESNTPPFEYGVYEHERGGAHAFYQRTVDDRGEQIGGDALSLIVESVRNA